YDAARAALARAWGRQTVNVATGGSIPLVNALQTAVPDAEILLLGASDGFSNIHAPNERVLLDEFRKSIVAEALFFEEYAGGWTGPNRSARVTAGDALAKRLRLQRRYDPRASCGRSTRGISLRSGGRYEVGILSVRSGAAH